MNDLEEQSRPLVRHQSDWALMPCTSVVLHFCFFNGSAYFGLCRYYDMNNKNYLRRRMKYQIFEGCSPLNYPYNYVQCYFAWRNSYTTSICHKQTQFTIWVTLHKIYFDLSMCEARSEANNKRIHSQTMDLGYVFYFIISNCNLLSKSGKPNHSNRSTWKCPI